MTIPSTVRTYPAFLSSNLQVERSNVHLEVLKPAQMSVCSPVGSQFDQSEIKAKEINNGVLKSINIDYESVY